MALGQRLKRGETKAIHCGLTGKSILPVSAWPVLAPSPGMISADMLQRDIVQGETFGEQNDHAPHKQVSRRFPASSRAPTFSARKREETPCRDKESYRPG